MKNLKFITTFIFLLCFINYNYSQNTFKKVFFGYNGHNDITFKPFNNDKSFLISGFGGGFKLFTINSTGNILFTRGINEFPGEYCNYIINNDTNITLIIGSTRNKTLFKLDTFLNITSAIQYDSINYNEIFLDENIICPIYYNQGYILSGSKIDSCMAIFKIDISGNILWSKYFTKIQGGIQDIIQVRDSGFLIASNLKNFGACLIKTDSSGNVLWCKSYIRPKGYIHSLLENNDGTIMITGSVDSTKTSYTSHTSPLFFIKLNRNGNVIWSKSFGDTINQLSQLPSHIKHTKDNAYIILSTLRKTDSNNDLLIIKTDTNGDTLWVRAHGSEKSYDCGYSIEVLSDNGYIISGITNNNIPTPLYSLYIIRTDSLGHTESLCEEYNLPLTINNIVVNDSNISVTSIPFTIHTSIPDTSIANYEAWSYDGCHLDEIPELIAEQTAPLVIYPNPTDGLFTLEAKTYTPVKSEIAIYNINGEKVYSGFTNENVTNINLSGYSRGLYFVRMSNERFVKTGKVMVE